MYESLAKFPVARFRTDVWRTCEQPPARVGIQRLRHQPIYWPIRVMLPRGVRSVTGVLNVKFSG